MKPAPAKNLLGIGAPGVSSPESDWEVPNIKIAVNLCVSY